jgi:NAD(P)-dependent dehydrogenase (short-subunit alcohol dehydrogenase family)
MKYALVTGSTNGIGKAIGDKLEEHGYTVFRNGRKTNSQYRTYIPADLSTLEGVNTLADHLLKRVDKLDVLVLNVGTTCRKPLPEITPNDWNLVMDANVNMPFFLIQRLSGLLAENGSILFISSAMSIWPHAVSLPYGVSKAAVNMLARGLVKEFAGRKIRVNVVCPGFIDTQWQLAKPAWLKEKIEKKTALNRFGTPEEVSDMCISLITNTYINGAIVSIDGGYNMI